MKIKLNNKKYKIKPSSLSSCSEYLNIIKHFEGSENIGVSAYIVKYLSLTLGLRFDEVLKYKISTKVFNKINNFVGFPEKPITLNELSMPKIIHYKQDYEVSDMDIHLAGVRVLMEQQKNKSEYELSIYLLAILFSQNFDSEKIENIYKDLLTLPYLDIIPLGGFFLSNLLHGRSSVSSYFKRQIRKLLTNIKLNKKNSTTEDYLSIVLYLK